MKEADKQEIIEEVLKQLRRDYFVVKRDSTLNEQQEQRNNLLIEYTALFACRETGIDLYKIKSKGSDSECVAARAITFYLLRLNYPFISLHSMGSFFNKDHSTALHHLRSMKDRMSVDKEYKKSIEDLNEKLKEERLNWVF